MILKHTFYQNINSSQFLLYTLLNYYSLYFYCLALEVQILDSSGILNTVRTHEPTNCFFSLCKEKFRIKHFSLKAMITMSKPSQSCNARALVALREISSRLSTLRCQE